MLCGNRDVAATVRTDWIHPANDGPDRRSRETVHFVAGTLVTTSHDEGQIREDPVTILCAAASGAPVQG